MSRGKQNVREPVMRRLPRYYRYLNELKNMEVKRTSSSKLGERMGLTSSQVRQDFNCFGGLGQQGIGYEVNVLLGSIRKILGLNSRYKVIIAGVGNVGHSLASYSEAASEGFDILALFDVNPRLIGCSVNGIMIYDIDDMKEFIREKGVDIGIICVPKDRAQATADIMIEAGIKGIWNFAAVDLYGPAEVVIENACLNDSLYTLTCRMNIHCF